MMAGLLEKVARLAAARAGTLADALAEAAANELPRDVKVAREDDAVVVSGRALAKRALTEVALRGLAVLARSLRK